MSPLGVSRRFLVAWLGLAILAAVIGGIQYLDHRRETSRGPHEPDARALLGAALDELGAIEIADRGRLHRFERDAAGAWFYHGLHTEATAVHTHAPDPALTERIGRTFAAFSRARIERQFPLDREAAVYGVAAPDVVVLAYRRGQSQPMAQYAVGHVAPDTASRYVMVVGRPVVVTIPTYQIDNLLDLIRAAGGDAGRGGAGAPGPPAERR